MRRIPLITLALALIPAGFAAGADGHFRGEIEILSYSWGSSQSAGAPSRAVSITPDLVEQVRKGTLRRLELEVPAGRLQDALALAHREQRSGSLSAKVPEGTGYCEIRFTDLKISSYSMSGSGARVVLQVGAASLAAGAGRGPGSIPAGRPDVGGPDQYASPVAVLPDLQIRDARQKAGDPLVLQVEIYNHGPGASAATRVKALYHQGGAVTAVQGGVPPLAAAQIAWVEVKLPGPLAAADHLTARVDDPNKVPESNEANNGFTVK